jgi:hypothetical protein
MTHPLLLALFDHPDAAAAAARELRHFGVPRESVSIVARSHREEGELAQAAGASPGSELEDSPNASVLGELGGHLIAAIALVLPGIGPIVADGPIAAELGEAAGHLAGDIGRTLERAGLDRALAEEWEGRVRDGHVLVGVHVGAGDVAATTAILERAGAVRLAQGVWPPA